MLLGDLAFSKFFNTLEVPLHIFHPKQSPARKELAKVTQENLGISGDLQCKELNLGQDMTWEMENNLRERGERGNTKVEWKWAGWTKRKRGLKRKGLEVAPQSEKWEAIEVVGQCWKAEVGPLVIGVMRSDEKGWILTGGQSGHLPNDMHCNDLP